ncbi:DUF3232 domain-containing protein [Desulfofundulus sp.]|uniref:DUF3232 domain-containing protein n=1 Tax=Desulfofundulus sp. TaxID=2282750 RepID=UPI003C715538
MGREDAAGGSAASKNSTKTKVMTLIEAINKSDGKFKNDDLLAVQEFIDDCGRYIERVTAMEAALQVARFRLEPEDYRQLIVDLDRGRKLAHDALIASVRLVNRLCGVYGVPKIYDGPDERIPIAEFAMEVTSEFFKERRL